MAFKCEVLKVKSVKDPPLIWIRISSLTHNLRGCKLLEQDQPHRRQWSNLTMCDRGCCTLYEDHHGKTRSFSQILLANAKKCIKVYNCFRFSAIPLLLLRRLRWLIRRTLCEPSSQSSSKIRKHLCHEICIDKPLHFRTIIVAEAKGFHA